MDRIGLEQFAKGIKSRLGEQLDFGSGIGRSAAKIALANLESANIINIRRNQNNRANGYELNMVVDIKRAILKIDQLKGEQNERKKKGAPQKKLFTMAKAQNKPKGEHKIFTEWWHDIVPKTRGVKPVYTAADMKNLKRILDLKILTQIQLQQIALYFLGNSSFRQFGPSMSTLFSSGIINGLMNRMENHPEFWKELNELTEQYLLHKFNAPEPGMLGKLAALKEALAKSKIMPAAREVDPLSAI